MKKTHKLPTDKDGHLLCANGDHRAGIGVVYQGKVYCHQCYLKIKGGK